MGGRIRRGWRMAGRGVLVPFEDRLPPPKPGWVDVDVLACGVCHTDVGYLYDGVPTATPNVVLGHEIVGKADGRLVIVPAVSPCGECPACKRGRRTSCARSLMPGNHHDGGFATVVQVPSRWLCPVPDWPAEKDPWPLAVVADAVTTPYQAIRRAHLGRGETAVVVGAGGVGGFLLELAAAMNAWTVAIDPSRRARERAEARGARLVFDPTGSEPRALRQLLARQLAEHERSLDGARIFECSGSPAGQTLAFALLGRGASLSVVGFTPETVPLRLSNVMAFDAEIYGNWGCDPSLYPEALQYVMNGAVDVAGAVERYPLSDAPAVLAAAHRHELTRRAVLVPDA